jgi:hypothetical protein
MHAELQTDIKKLATALVYANVLRFSVQKTILVEVL